MLKSPVFYYRWISEAYSIQISLIVLLYILNTFHWFNNKPMPWHNSELVAEENLAMLFFQENSFWYV